MADSENLIGVKKQNSAEKLVCDNDNSEEKNTQNSTQENCDQNCEVLEKTCEKSLDDKILCENITVAQKEIVKHHDKSVENIAEELYKKNMNIEAVADANIVAENIVEAQKEIVEETSVTESAVEEVAKVAEHTLVSEVAGSKEIDANEEQVPEAVTIKDLATVENVSDEICADKVCVEEGIDVSEKCEIVDVAETSDETSSISDLLYNNDKDYRIYHGSDTSEGIIILEEKIIASEIAEIEIIDKNDTEKEKKSAEIVDSKIIEVAVQKQKEKRQNEEIKNVDNYKKEKQKTTAKIEQTDTKKVAVISKEKEKYKNGTKIKDGGKKLKTAKFFENTFTPFAVRNEQIADKAKVREETISNAKAVLVKVSVETVKSRNNIEVTGKHKTKPVIVLHNINSDEVDARKKNIKYNSMNVMPKGSKPKFEYSPPTEPIVTKVQCDGSVVMKLIKHCHEAGNELAQGALLGLLIDKCLEITHCFPYPKRDDDTYDEDAYQLNLMRRLRRVNVDHFHVGWYQNSKMGNFMSRNILESQFNYQTNIEESVVLIYDTVKSARGLPCFNAYRLTKSAMEMYKKGDFTAQGMYNTKVGYENLYDEIPITFKTSTLTNIAITELEELMPADNGSDELQLGTDAVLSTYLTTLNAGIDQLFSDTLQQFKFLVGNSKMEAAKKVALNNLQEDNANRVAKGEPTVSEDEVLKNYQPLPPLRCIGSSITSNVMEMNTNSMLHFCNQSMAKLLITKHLHKSSKMRYKTKTSATDDETDL